jgi:transcriptional regulator with XRE-family HTH domain
MAFAETLKSLREKNHITQSDLAKQIGVTQRTISYYETGKGVPGDPKILNTLAKIFNVTLDELLLDDQQISKFHALVKKLIDDTKKEKLEWSPFEYASYDYITETNFHTHGFYKDQFNPNELLQYKNCEFSIKESFFAQYNTGGYLVTKIILPDKDIDVALFVLFDDNFSYIANKDSIKQIEELYFILSNKSSGVNTFINHYLEDDLAQEKPAQQNSNQPIKDEDIPF